MNETIDTYMDLIRRHAYIALKKVKKPADNDIEDLAQEGALVFLSVRKLYKENKGAAFKSFLTLCLRHHFANIVSRSYRNRKTTDPEFENRISYRTFKISHSAFDMVSVIYILDAFSPDELEYVKTILSFAEKSTKYRRKLTREVLEISYEREGELRRSVHDKIRK